MADLHEFLIDQLDTPQTRSLQQFDLWFDEEVECYLWDKETRSRTRRVPDGSANVLSGQVMCRVNRFQGCAEDVVEDVVYACATTEFLGGDLKGGSFDGSDEISSEIGHEFENQRALVVVEDTAGLLTRRRKEDGTTCSLDAALPKTSHLQRRSAPAEFDPSTCSVSPSYLATCRGCDSSGPRTGKKRGASLAAQSISGQPPGKGPHGSTSLPSTLFHIYVPNFDTPSES